MLGRNMQAVLRGSGQPPFAQHVASSATHCSRTNTNCNICFQPTLGCSSSAMSPYSTPYPTRLTSPFAPRHHVVPRNARAMSSRSGGNSEAKGEHPSSSQATPSPLSRRTPGMVSPKPKKLSNALSLLSVPGIGPKNESMFKAKGIHNIEDLKLIHFNMHKADSDMTRGFVETAVGIRNKAHISSILDYLQMLHQPTPHATNPRVTLSVEGNIGSGKSTFLRILETNAVHETLQVVPEPVEKWQSVGAGKVNLLMEFYRAPERFAYTFQNFVFLTRLVQERESYISTKMCRLLERSVFSDRMVFVRAVHKAKFMNDAELSIYDSWFDPVLKTMPTLVPNGFIYLRAGPDTCHRRMMSRGRAEENTVELDYLAGLHENHEDWLFTGNQRMGDPNAPGYLYVPPTRQVLTTTGGAYHLDPAVHPPPPEAATISIKSADGFAMSPEGYKFKLPAVPHALRDSLYIIDAKNRAHMHPTLDQIPALIIDCDEDVDVDRDDAYKESVSNKVKHYTAYVRDFMNAKMGAVPPERLGASTYPRPLVLGQQGSADLWQPGGGKQATLTLP